MHLILLTSTKEVWIALLAVGFSISRANVFFFVVPTRFPIFFPLFSLCTYYLPRVLGNLHCRTRLLAMFLHTADVSHSDLLFLCDIQCISQLHRSICVFSNVFHVYHYLLHVVFTIIITYSLITCLHSYHFYYFDFVSLWGCRLPGRIYQFLLRCDVLCISVVWRVSLPAMLRNPLCWLQERAWRYGPKDKERPMHFILSVQIFFS